MCLDDSYSFELQEKLKRAESFEELLSVVQAEGYDLPDDQLDAVFGGIGMECMHCVEQADFDGVDVSLKRYLEE